MQKAKAGEGTALERFEAAMRGAIYELASNPALCLNLMLATGRMEAMAEILTASDRAVTAPLRELLIEARAVGDAGVADIDHHLLAHGWNQHGTVTSPRSDVWAVLADYPNIVEWNKAVKTSYAIGDTIEGVGAQRQVNVDSKGSIKNRETVTEWTPEHRMVIAVDKIESNPSNTPP